MIASGFRLLVLWLCMVSVGLGCATQQDDQPRAAAFEGSAASSPRIGAVASGDEIANRIGLQVLSEGGNAVDAAVAVGFALAVTMPSAGNIGGGGFMTIYLADGEVTTIDFRETAPGLAHGEMYLDEDGNPQPELTLTGPLAAGVPGTVKGFEYVLARYGSLPLAEVVAPAVELAEKGFVIHEGLARSLASAGDRFLQFPATAEIFLNRGEPFSAGDLLIQTDLARTLRLIAREGSEVFYRGSIADLIVAEMERTGGLITREDLAMYEVQEREPVTGNYRGYEIHSMGPPSSGGVAIVQALNVLEGYPLREYGHNSSRTIHLVVETLKRVYADRARWLGDPGFADVPIDRLTSTDYAAQLRREIDDSRATRSEDIASGSRQLNHGESEETTHYSVIDSHGNAVSTTVTLDRGYGNSQVVTGAGFLLNNEMHDFDALAGGPDRTGFVYSGDANSIEPHKRPLSSMSPTVVTKDGEVHLVLGAAGGPRIITHVLQVMMNVIDHGMPLATAVSAPRFHHQWQPDHLYLQRWGFPTDVRRALEALGHIGDGLHGNELPEPQRNRIEQAGRMIFVPR